MTEKRLIMPKPNEKQLLALGETHRYVAYGGARGGGKSWFVRWKAVLLALAGAWAATALDVELLRKPFGVYLLLSGVSLLWPQKK